MRLSRQNTDEPEKRRFYIMNKHEHNQSIHCDVVSCSHNDREGACALKSIKVSPCPNCNSGSKDTESMCASYEAK